MRPATRQRILFSLLTLSGICGKFKPPLSVTASLTVSRLRFWYCTVSSELEVFSTEEPVRKLDPERITVGYASDVVVEVRCISSNESASVNWMFADNNTAVPSGLKPFNTSQGGGGLLRIYPASILSTNGTKFLCRDAENDQTLNVTFELSKPHTKVNCQLSFNSNVWGVILYTFFFICRGTPFFHRI